MTLWNWVAVVIGPAALWAAYHYFKDRHRPEPLHHLLLAYALGIGAGALGPYAYALLDVVGLRYDAYELAATNTPGLLAYSILGIGLLEESVKFLPFWLVALRLPPFDEPIDGIVYASFIALGFASYENVHYLSFVSGPEALARGVSSPLVHSMFASIWGYTCARAAIAGSRLLPAAAAGLALAALAHGLYDFVTIGLPAWSRPVAAMLILGVWLWRMHLIRRLQQEHQAEAAGQGGP